MGELSLCHWVMTMNFRGLTGQAGGAGGNYTPELGG